MEYYEFNAVNPKNKNSGGNKFILLKNIALGAMLVSLMFIGTLMSWKNEGVPTGITVFYNILIILLVEVPLFGLFLLFKKLSKKYFEYDYFILGNTLKIVKIFNKSSRKSVLELPLSDVERLGIYLSDNYSKMVVSITPVKSFACNIESPFYLYISASDERDGRVIYVLEYDLMFVSALRKALKRETAFDKDLLLVMRKEQKSANAVDAADKNGHESALPSDKEEKQ